MEALGFTNIDYEAVEARLGIPKRPSSLPLPYKKPPRDRTLEAKIFAPEPELTPTEWKDPQKILVRIRTVQVGVEKLVPKLESLGENCKTMRLNLDDEQEALYNLKIYSTLREINGWIEKLSKRMDERNEERDLMAKKFEDQVDFGNEKMEGIVMRGKKVENKAWWMEKPWYEKGEFYQSEEYYERQYNRDK
ncbi:hypothetical protein TWF281_004095 [Arthrobotrys megalospora]